MPRRAVLLTAALCLAACGRDAAPPAPAGLDDPGVANALADPLMIDPDLTSQNHANALASLPPLSAEIPAIDNSVDEAERARAEAMAILGGYSALRHAPDAQRQAGGNSAAISIKERAAAAPATGDCAGAATATALWAARMPGEFPVYPRAAMLEAAGTDGDGCRLRAIRFQTPVQVAEVIDFYFTRAATAGFAIRHTLRAGDDILESSHGDRSIALYTRRLSTGLTSVDLITNQ